MNGAGKGTVFLARATYRQRRLRDVARLLPLFGCFLWFIPLLWPQDSDATPANSQTVIYVFVVWVLLIVFSALITSRMTHDVAEVEDVSS